MTTEERLGRLEERSDHLIDKVDDIRGNIGKIFDKLEAVTQIKERVKGLGVRVTWLYFAFAIVILGGVVLGVYLDAGPK